MQYIQKLEMPPVDWEHWFTIYSDDGGRRSYDYGIDYPALLNLHLAKAFLLNEQNGLCAYCQKTINNEDASIEHIIPKEHNLSLSTNYYNLVAVCKSPVRDPATGRLHCDKERGSKLLPNLIFYKTATVLDSVNHAFIDVYSDGTIVPKYQLPEEIKQQVSCYIEILNLNHSLLKQSREKDVLEGMLEVFKDVPAHQKSIFWRTQFNRVANNLKQPFRQFLLIYLAKKLGIN